MLTGLKSNDKSALMTDVIAKQFDHLTRMTGALWSWILVESKKMRGRELVYIEGMAWKTKGRFDPSKQPFSYWHVSFIINDLRPICYGWGAPQKAGLNHHPTSPSTHWSRTYGMRGKLKRKEFRDDESNVNGPEVNRSNVNGPGWTDQKATWHWIGHYVVSKKS